MRSVAVSVLEERLEHAEKVNTGLEEAALTTARALQKISAHWDRVYEAMRRKDTTARRQTAFSRGAPVLRSV